LLRVDILKNKKMTKFTIYPNEIKLGKRIIKGKLPGLNEFIAAINKNRYVGNLLKAKIESNIIECIKNQLGNLEIDAQVEISYFWIEPNMKRDKDNICSAKKFVNDALVNSGVLKNDGWKNIDGFKDFFEVDKKNPRVEVEIRSVRNE
jgi:Holliday junction resolvase RusA-like endonuclease